MVDKNDDVTRVRRIVDLPRVGYVSAGAYSLDLPADQDEFLVPTADILGCSCLLELGNLELIPEQLSDPIDLDGSDPENNADEEEKEN